MRPLRSADRIRLAGSALIDSLESLCYPHNTASRKERRSMPQGKFVRTLIIFLLLCLAPRIGYGQTRTKMVFGYASMSSVVTTLWVAQEKGFFAKNGIDVQTVFIPGSPTLIASIRTPLTLELLQRSPRCRIYCERSGRSTPDHDNSAAPSQQMALRAIKSRSYSHACEWEPLREYTWADRSAAHAVRRRP